MVGHYFFSQTYPFGQTKATQIETPLRMSSGIVHDVVIDFPRGCIYTTHVKVMRAEFQVFPRNSGAYYAYDGYPLEIGDYWLLRPLENELTMVGYNVDEAKNHTIRIALQVTEPERYFAERGLLDRMEQFLDLQRAIIGTPQPSHLGGGTEE